MKNVVLLVLGSLVVVFVIAGLMFKADRSPGKLDEFATCLGEKGAIFYGAFWCPHCQNQKKLFGNSDKKLPYIECSTPDGNSQLEVCTAAGITGYPTWVFGDESRLGGEVSLQVLSEKTECALPEEV